MTHEENDTDPLDSAWSFVVTDPETGESDIIGFDYAVLPNGCVKIDCVLDCNTSHFTDSFGAGRGDVAAEVAVITLQLLVAQAKDWFAENHPGRRVFGGMSIRKMLVALRRDLREAKK